MTTPLSHPTQTQSSRTEAELRARWARYSNAALGLWLFISAFAWEHAPSSRINTALVGLFVLVSAVTATGWAMVRHLTMVLALWLAFSTLAAYPDGPAASWNNMVVAFIIIVLAELPDELTQRLRR